MKIRFILTSILFATASSAFAQQAERDFAFENYRHFSPRLHRLLPNKPNATSLSKTTVATIRKRPSTIKTATSWKR